MTCPQQGNDTAEHQLCDDCGRCVTCDRGWQYLVGSKLLCHWCLSRGRPWA